MSISPADSALYGTLFSDPEVAAARIDDVVASFEPDIAGIAAGTEKSGVPIIPLVEQLRTAVGGEAAGYVHWGATRQRYIAALRTADNLDISPLLDFARS